MSRNFFDADFQPAKFAVRHAFSHFTHENSHSSAMCAAVTL